MPYTGSAGGPAGEAAGAPSVFNPTVWSVCIPPPDELKAFPSTSALPSFQVRGRHGGFFGLSPLQGILG